MEREEKAVRIEQLAATILDKWENGEASQVGGPDDHGVEEEIFEKAMQKASEEWNRLHPRPKPPVRLIDLPVAEACRLKWERGVAEHGPVMRLNPLEEIFAELIDIRNYCMVAKQMKEIPEPAKGGLDVLIALSEGMAEAFQQLVRSQPEPYVVFEPRYIP